VTIRAWLRAARPLAHGNIAPPILFGAALGAQPSGHLDAAMLAWALGFGLLDHLTIVFFNDVADLDADRQQVDPTWVSGGSRVLVEGALTPAQLSRAAASTALGLVALSLALAASRPAMPCLAALALLLLWLYSGRPARLSYRGGGAILQGLGVGVVLPLVGFASQRPGLPPLSALAPSFLLGVAGNVLTAMPDAEADRAADKRTLAARRGPHIAAWASALLGALAIVLGASLFARDAATSGWLTWPPTLLLLASLTQLRALDRDRRARLAFVLLGLASGTSGLVAWTVALLAG
jgi:1,4-dihydroxy-2-naphthoate octaprenyltransferase